MLGLQSIEATIQKLQLQWVAHCARRGDRDLTWQRMRQEIEDDQSSWGLVQKEWGKLGVQSVARQGGKLQMAVEQAMLKLSRGEHRGANPANTQAS